MTGLTKAERLAVDTAIANRVDELERAITRHSENSGLSTVRAEWREQIDALLTARPKIAMMRRTQ